MAALARADVFVLIDGGQVRGELVNKDQEPRKNYHVKTATGGDVLLEADQVKSVEPQSEQQQEFDRLRWKFDETPDEQWKLAEWCREQRLSKERDEVLAHIIELDPEYAPARHALDYTQIGGKWVTEREHMESQGYVRYKGRWVTSQELELAERDRKNELAEKEWIIKVKRWRGWLNGSKAVQGRQNLLAIDDPYAAKALSLAIKEEKVREASLIYVDALAHIGQPNAMDVLVVASIDHDDEEVRIACLDRIVRANYDRAAGIYVQKLKDADNRIVNRAGSALASLKDASSVGPLIDALVTKHKFKFVPQNPGQISSTFGSGGAGGSPGGFSFGQAKEKIVTRELTNQAVLEALIIITSQNFNFDTRAWRYWFAAQKKPATLDARRD
jgi:hypothetical protein